MPRSGASALGVLALGAALMLGGCSTAATGGSGASASGGSGTAGHGTSGHQSGSTSSSSSTTTSTTVPARYVVVGGKRVKVPSEHGDNLPIGKSSDHGQQIVISQHAFVPRTLYADTHFPVVWTNLSSVTERLTLDHGKVHSGPIPPGGRWVWHYHRIIAFQYTSNTGLVGYLVDGALP